MLIIKKGNVLEATENLICHQVNENGVMGGGLALQIANKYPNVERDYKNFLRTELEPIGMWQWVELEKGKYIVNCFTQKDFETQYTEIKNIFSYLKKLCIERDYSICIPYKYGCGIANGSWEQVESILLDIFTDYDITIYKLD